MSHQQNIGQIRNKKATHKSFENIVKLKYEYLERKEHELRVFENRVLRKIFGAKTDQQQGGENYVTRSLKNMVEVIKSKIKKWARHIIHGEMRN
jgi:hypothetical protein